MKASIYQLALVLLILTFAIACSGPHMPLDRSKDSGASNGKLGSGGNALTFNGSVGQIFATRCVPCHAPGGALPNWQDYDTAFGRKERLKDRVIVQKNMPPPAQSKLTDEERALIGKWLDAGAPKGEESTTPVATGPSPAPTAAPAPVSAQPEPNVILAYDAAGGMKEWFAKNCGACHDGSMTDSGAPSWLDYDQVFAKKDRLFQRVLVDRDMPMGGMTPEGLEFTEEQRATLKAWLEKGAPR